MAASALGPVAESVYGLLQDATLLAALPGGWHDDVPQNADYPYGWYELFTERDIRGLGTGGLPEIELRTHVFSQYGGLSEAREINRLTIAVLKDATVAVTGYSQCGQIVYRESVLLSDEEIAGVKVHEIVSIFTIWVEE